MVDDRGFERSLLDTSPAEVHAQLKEANRRQLERRVARGGSIAAYRTLEGAPIGDRVSFGPVLSALRAKKRPLDPQGRGNLKALAAGALWTQDRLKEAGYDVAANCPHMRGGQGHLVPSLVALPFFRGNPQQGCPGTCAQVGGGCRRLFPGFL